MKVTDGKFAQLNYVELSKELDILLVNDKLLTTANIQINENYQSVLD